ncbi:MAG: CDP-alcohol phosphatidyltransferase family protein [Chthoniobacterales bacterium]
MNKVPAVLVCDPGTGNLKIAGLTVLDRMVIAAHRAGCAPIVITADAPPSLPRAEALGIETSHVTSSPEDAVAAALRRRAGERPDAAGRLQHPALIINGGVLVDPRDVERVIRAGGELFAADGSPLPVKMTTIESPPVIALGFACAVTDAVSAREAERKFWASLGSTADGLVDRYFNRPLGRLLSKLLVHTSVSPNEVSIVSILIGVAAAPFFAAGEFVVGALLLQLCAVVDCVDGDLARALFKESRLGKWLDIGGDQVVHCSVFVGIGIGVALTNPAVPALLLGASAALGVLICFPLIVRGLRRPRSARGDLLNKLLDATANRDFSVLLLVLAICGRLDLFLWMAGIGIHLFWITLLVLERIGSSRGTSAAIRRESA